MRVRALWSEAEEARVPPSEPDALSELLVDRPSSPAVASSVPSKLNTYMALCGSPRLRALIPPPGVGTPHMGDTAPAAGTPGLMTPLSPALMLGARLESRRRCRSAAVGDPDGGAMVSLLGFRDGELRGIRLAPGPFTTVSSSWMPHTAAEGTPAPAPAPMVSIPARPATDTSMDSSWVRRSNSAALAPGDSSFRSSSHGSLVTCSASRGGGTVTGAGTQLLGELLSLLDTLDTWARNVAVTGLATASCPESVLAPDVE